MAQIKNFGLTGVASDVQFGKGGARLVQSGGLFALRDAAGAFTRLQIADPSLGNDAVHKSYVDAGISAIQSELDLTQTSVGLSANGSLPALVGSYISASTSIRAAVEALDAALQSEAAARAAADAALGVRIDGATTAIGQVFASFTAFESTVNGSLTTIGTTLADHGTRITGLEGRMTTAEGEIDAAFASFTAFETLATGSLNNLGTRVAALEAGNTGVQAELDLTQASIGLAPSGSYVAPLSNYGATATTVLGLVGAIDTALFGVDNNLTAVEGAVGLGADGSLAAFTGASYIALSTTVRGALVALDTALSAENADRVADQAALQSEIDAAEDAIAAQGTFFAGQISTVNGRIDAETLARIDAVGSINNAILAEQTARIAGDSLNAANIASIAAAYINKDGSVAFTGNQSMGNFRLTDLGTPSLIADAVTKGYVDGLVGALGNAFNYVGTVTGGESSTPFNMAGLAENDPGDYYKVATAGWFVVGTGTPFFANANDGLVFNNSSGVDIIDNSDSVVFGSGNIAVSGSTDVGFTVDLSTSFLSRVGTIETNVGSLQTGLAAETAARIAADTVLTTALDTLEGEFNGFVTLQSANNLSQQAQIDSNASLIAAETAARIAADNGLGSLITAESNARAAADASIVSSLADVQATLLADIAALDGRLDLIEPEQVVQNARLTSLETGLQNANASLVSRIAAAEASITEVDTFARGSLAALTTFTNGSLTALTSYVDAEITILEGSIASVEAAAAAALTAASSALSTAISNASAALSTAITNVDGNLSAVETSVGLDAAGAIPAGAFTGSYVGGASTVIGAINSLGDAAGAAIEAERVARAAADAALQAELDATQALIGFSAPNGTTLVWSSNAPAYVQSALTVIEAIEDTANALTNLSQDEIRSASGQTRVKAATGGVEVSVPVGSGTFLAMTVEATASADSSMAMVATAGEVQMVAEGTPANVNIRLIPKGTGQVFIGSENATSGVIGAEPGEDLIITGGNTPSGAAGDLILKGGDGETDGIVEVQNGTGEAIARFTNAGPNRLDFTGGSTTLGLVAAGSGNVDIVIDPLGTGRVDVSNAVVANVATPSNASDAANKGYVDTQVATSITNAFAGAVRTRVVTLTGAGSVNLGDTIVGTVLRVKVNVTSAFGAGQVLNVGVSGNTAALAAASESDLETTGIYLIENATAYGSATQLLAEVTGTGTGTATVVVEYLQG